jgi:hypothetical protein
MGSGILVEVLAENEYKPGGEHQHSETAEQNAQ